VIRDCCQQRRGRRPRIQRFDEAEEVEHDLPPAFVRSGTRLPAMRCIRPRRILLPNVHRRFESSMKGRTRRICYQQCLECLPRPLLIALHERDQGDELSEELLVKGLARVSARQHELADQIGL